MSRITVRPLLVYYLGATPVFFLVDVGPDIAASVAWWSFQRWTRVLAVRSRAVYR